MPLRSRYAGATHRQRSIVPRRTWPEIAPAYHLKDGSQFADDHLCTDAELVALHFDAVPEFRTDGVGAGAPEFREQLEEYLFNLKVAVKLALATLGTQRTSW